MADIDFGSIATIDSEVSQSETVCAYASGRVPRYSIKGTGSGVGGAYTLSNGTSTLAYEVQWNAQANQTTGTMLPTGTTLSGQPSNAVLATCTLGLTPSGSLTIVLRSTALSAARSGTFTGTLTLLLVPN